MQTYEIRLLDAGGTVVLIHLTRCETDREAEAHVATIGDMDYATFEIWTGMHKVCEGPRKLPE